MMASESRPPKLTLFCPECSHCAPISGDWRRVERENVVELFCPSCRASIVRRPRR